MRHLSPPFACPHPRTFHPPTHLTLPNLSSPPLPPVAGFQPRTAGLLSSRSATGVVLRVARRRDELSAGADDGGWGMDFTLGGVAQPPAHLRGVQMAT